MEWWAILLIIFAGAMFLLGLGMPVAFAFILVNIIGVVVFQGGGTAFNTMVVSMYSSAASFTLLPIPLFILMGEILWQTRIASVALDAVDKFLGRVPGRLAVLTVVSGSGFAALSGSSMANTALLGTLLLPEMDRRGYHRSMSIGPIMASASLAMIIPPSSLAVILATIGQISIGKLLIASIIPGLLLAVLFFLYVIGRCALQPGLAPAYEVGSVTVRERLLALARLLPLGLIVFLVSGVIVLGIATPTEAAALGCLGSFVLACFYGGLTREVLRKSLVGTAEVTIMVFIILVGATGFSQLLAFSGASRGLVDAVGALDVPPIWLVVAMLAIVFVLGTFMEEVSIMMITMPLYMPIIKTLGFDPVWFGVLMLINVEIALISPPFGMILFVMKGVAPPNTSMREIFNAGYPFIACQAVAMLLILLVPEIAMWLVNATSIKR